MVQNAAKTKKAPQRTCVGCRLVNVKKSLIRIVRSPEGVFIDLTGKMNGRGAYVHKQRSCWRAALKGGLANALKTTLNDEDRVRLDDYYQTLPDDTATDNAENVQT